jgi:hypothetical protein
MWFMSFKTIQSFHNALMRRVFSILIILSAVTIGCGTKQDEASNPILQTATVLPVKATPTDSVSTSIPSETAVALPTVTVAPKSTFTPIPTLSVAEQEDYLLKLLSENGNCELPCWWTIEPGTTNWQDAKAIFAPLGYGGGLYSTMGDMLSYDFPLAVNQSETTNLLVRIGVQNDVVQQIYVLADNINVPKSNVAHSPKYSRAMQSHSLGQLLKSYGVPSEIIIGLRAYPAEQNAPLLYSIWVFYDKLGILVSYRGEGITTRQDTITLCPKADKVNLQQFYLQSPQSLTPIKKMADEIMQLEMILSEGILRPLDESTDLSPEEFYKLITGDPEKACFQSPADLWP